MSKFDQLCACEDKEQRIVPTGLAAGDNEIKQHRNFSDMHFREWLPADAVRDGAIHDWAMTKVQ